MVKNLVLIGLSLFASSAYADNAALNGTWKSSKSYCLSGAKIGLINPYKYDDQRVTFLDGKASSVITFELVGAAITYDYQINGDQISIRNHVCQIDPGSLAGYNIELPDADLNFEISGKQLKFVMPAGKESPNCPDGDREVDTYVKIGK